MDIFGNTEIDNALQGGQNVEVGEITVLDKLTVKGPSGSGAYDVTNSTDAIGTFDLPTEKNNISTNTTDINNINTSIGSANGICPLDASSLIPVIYIPPSTGSLPLTGGTMTGPINMNGNNITNVDLFQVIGLPANEIVETTGTSFLTTVSKNTAYNKPFGLLSSQVMEGNRLDDASLTSDKLWSAQKIANSISTEVGNALPLTGGTMTGNIDMGSNNITNATQLETDEVLISAPSNARLIIKDEGAVTQDAATGRILIQDQNNNNSGFIGMFNGDVIVENNNNKQVKLSADSGNHTVVLDSSGLESSQSLTINNPIPRTILKSGVVGSTIETCVGLFQIRDNSDNIASQINMSGGTLRILNNASQGIEINDVSKLTTVKGGLQVDEDSALLGITTLGSGAVLESTLPTESITVGLYTQNASDNDTTVVNWSVGGVDWVAETDGILAGQGTHPAKCFNQSISERYLSLREYSTTGSVYFGTASTNGYAGSWIQVGTTNSIMSNVGSFSQYVSAFSAPKDFRLYSSNDGVTWTFEQEYLGNVFNAGTATQTFTITNPITAKYIRMAVNKINWDSGGNGYHHQYDLRFYSADCVINCLDIKNCSARVENDLTVGSNLTVNAIAEFKAGQTTILNPVVMGSTLDVMDDAVISGDLSVGSTGVLDLSALPYTFTFESFFSGQTNDIFFNTDPSDWVASGPPGGYSSTTGVYVGSGTTLGGVNGYWHQIDYGNVASVIDQFSVSCSFIGINNTFNTPKDIYVYGSNDGVTYTQIHVQNTTRAEWTVGSVYNDYAITGAGSYTKYRFVFANVDATGAATDTYIRLNGIKLSTSASTPFGDVEIGRDLTIGNSVTVDGVLQDTNEDIYGSLHDTSTNLKEMSFTAGQMKDITNANLSAPMTLVSEQFGNVTAGTTEMKYTVNQSGVFKIDASVNTSPADDGTLLTLSICKNSVVTNYSNTSLKVKNRITTQSVQGVLTLLVGDFVTLCITSDAAETVEVSNANLTLFRLRKNI